MTNIMGEYEKEQLQVELSYTRNELATERMKGDAADTYKIDRLEQAEARLVAQIKTIEGPDAVEQINFAIATAQDELDNVLDNLQIGDEVVSIRAFTVDETAYQVLYIALKQLISTQAETAASNMRILKESYEAQIKDLNADKMELTDQLMDMTAKRDAAASAIVELTEAKEESARLTDENEKLRNQIVAVAANTKTNTETTEDGKAKLQEWKNNRPGIYNLRWKDELKRTIYLAELATNGETIEIPLLEKGKYREVTSEEVERFRSEEAAKLAEAERLAEEAIQNQPLVIPTLPSEGSEHGLDETNESLEVAERPVSREEFNQLASRVAQIERERVNAA